MIIALIRNKINPNLSNPFKYLEFDFKEKISSLDKNPALWKSAIHCIVLGSLGFRLPLDLLKKLGIYGDDLVKLASIGILFYDGGEYTVRHERWGAEFLLYLYTTTYGKDFEAFDKRDHLVDFIRSLFAELPAVYNHHSVFNRLESMLAEDKFVKFVKSLMGKLEIPSHLSNNDAADLLCYGFGNFYNTAKDHELALYFYDESY